MIRFCLVVVKAAVVGSHAHADRPPAAGIVKAKRVDRETLNAAVKAQGSSNHPLSSEDVTSTGLK
jgi:hypothetical protein